MHLGFAAAAIIVHPSVPARTLAELVALYTNDEREKGTLENAELKKHITDQNAEKERILKQHEIEGLTGLKTRKVFMQKLEEELIEPTPQ